MPTNVGSSRTVPGCTLDGKLGVGVERDWGFRVLHLEGKEMPTSCPPTLEAVGQCLDTPWTVTEELGFP